MGAGCGEAADVVAGEGEGVAAEEGGVTEGVAAGASMDGADGAGRATAEPVTRE
jgi:hypothetical protein